MVLNIIKYNVVNDDEQVINLSSLCCKHATRKSLYITQFVLTY